MLGLLIRRSPTVTCSGLHWPSCTRCRHNVSLGQSTEMRACRIIGQCETPEIPFMLWAACHRPFGDPSFPSFFLVSLPGSSIHKTPTYQNLGQKGKKIPSSRSSSGSSIVIIREPRMSRAASMPNGEDVAVCLILRLPCTAPPIKRHTFCMDGFLIVRLSLLWPPRVPILMDSASLVGGLASRP